MVRCRVKMRGMRCRQSGARAPGYSNRSNSSRPFCVTVSTCAARPSPNGPANPPDREEPRRQARQLARCGVDRALRFDRSSSVDEKSRSVEVSLWSYKPPLRRPKLRRVQVSGSGKKFQERPQSTRSASFAVAAVPTHAWRSASWPNASAVGIRCARRTNESDLSDCHSVWRAFENSGEAMRLSPTALSRRGSDLELPMTHITGAMP